MFRFYLAALVVVSIASVAQAQVILEEGEAKSEGPADLTIAQFDPADAVSPINVVEGPGVKVSEGTTIHPVFGIETGFDSNVFFQNANTQAGGVFRLIGQIGTSSLNRARVDANLADGQSETPMNNYGSFEYQASLRASYDEVVAQSGVASAASGLGLGALFQAYVNPAGKFAFGFDENFIRLIRAPDYETSTNENRDVNKLRLTLLYQPPGRSVNAYVYYSNLIDALEDTPQPYPDRIDNRVGFHPTWRVLPQTTLYSDISEGVVTGIGSSTASQEKVTSFPLIARAGISTLLGIKTTFVFQAGYTNGFYSRGPSFSAPLIDTGLTYRYSPTGKVAIQYDLGYADSINANYYRDDAITLSIQQAFLPFVVAIMPQIRFREYSGVTFPGNSADRYDTIYSVLAGIHYNLKQSIALSIDYRFSAVETDFRYMDTTGDTIDPSYAKHELLAGVRAAL